jgi:hypothetical protein
MGKKKEIGICKLCGKTTELTFEHVPPKSAFNNKSVKMIDGTETIKMLTDSQREPWDPSGLKGYILQQGQGGYFLCKECNNNTGAWYGKYYKKFIFGMHGVASQTKSVPEEWAKVIATDIYPLAIFKQIMVMFCNINNGCMGDDSLRDFLLNKSSNTFNKDKFRVFTYIHKCTLERLCGVVALLIEGGTILTVSEISKYPIGFALYIDLPKNIKPRGCEITSFADRKYEEKCNVTISIPVFESNTILPTDYRTKSEILKCQEDTRKWMEDNKDLIEKQEKNNE